MTLNDLNPMQRKAAETLEGPVLILAGAGSGKTRALTYRIANMVEHGVAPYNIMALTFTNKAAREMKERISRLVGQSTDDMWVGTFHSICVRILRRDIEKLGYQRCFTIYDDDDSERVIKESIKALNIDEKTLSWRDVKYAISDAKNKVMTPDEWFRASRRDYRSQRIHDVFVRYEDKLRTSNALDFDDLLIRTLQLFVDHLPVLEYYKRKFRYIHVDEYQDTNMAQYQLVKLLSQDSRNLCVVGDDDQSIYGWRGADIRNILDFEEDFPDAKVYKLEQNYRSTSNILDAANQVIAHNRGRKEKVLWTENGEGAPILLFGAGDEREEAAWICEQLRQLERGGEPYSDMAVLYRTRAQSRVIEEMLVRAGMPYRVFGDQRFYDRKEIKDALAYLRVIVNRNDDVSLERIINTPRRSIGESTVDVIRKCAADRGVPMFDVLGDLPGQLSSRPQKCVAEFAALMNGLTEKRQSMSLSEFIEEMLDESGLIRQYDGGSEEGQSHIQNLREFVGAASDFEKHSEDSSLEAFLENVALITDLDRQEDSPKYVTLMTLHSCKGLEFKNVFIAGLEEGLFPNIRSIMDDARLEEERRLCYVGITRARERLYLSYARRRILNNQIMHNDRSRFLKEIPQRLLHDEWASVKTNRSLTASTPAWKRPQAPKVEFPRARKPNLSFGTPGMGQHAPLNIPGVTKGFVPSKAREEEESVLQTLFQAGDTVLHRKFGEGKVIEVFGVGSEARIRIFFTAYGEKVFSLSIAPIVKIENK